MENYNISDTAKKAMEVFFRRHSREKHTFNISEISKNLEILEIYLGIRDKKRIKFHKNGNHGFQKRLNHLHIVR